MWSQVIRLLRARGLSHYRIASELGVSQSAICRLESGDITEPKYSTGAMLIQLAGGADVLHQHGVDVTAAARLPAKLEGVANA